MRIAIFSDAKAYGDDSKDSENSEEDVVERCGEKMRKST